MQSRSTLFPLIRQLRPRYPIQTKGTFAQERCLSSLRPFTTALPNSPLHRRQLARLIPASRGTPLTYTRFSSTSPSPPVPSPIAQSEPPPEDPPRYQLTFTCRPCSHRSTHTITKHGYSKGTVLVTCPQCKNRHVIADHLGIFSDRSITVEDILREKGELVRRGRVGVGGEDVEFWDEGAEELQGR